ncbi:MAG: hypothetical protein JNL58_01940 [Planctomyces sp.]|nr:hypothetical protein [Planctomyces sp.]
MRTFLTTKEPHHHPVVLFRVFRLFRGYPSHWRRDGCHQGRTRGLVITAERDEYFSTTKDTSRTEVDSNYQHR